MPRDVDLLRRLRAFRLDVDEVYGWEERGSEAFDPEGSLHHHTGGGGSSPQPSLGICIRGRGGPNPLPGPLCNVHTPREQSYRVNLVAAGKANHGGDGLWLGLRGNRKLWGLESEHSGGPNEPYTNIQIDRDARVHAAFLWGSGHGAEFVAQHREYALPPGRKPDFVRARLDPDAFRTLVAQHLLYMERHGHAMPRIGDDPDPEDDDMLHLFYVEDPENMPAPMSDGTLWYLTDGKAFWWCPSPGHAEHLADAGLLESATPVARPSWFIKSLQPRSPFDLAPRTGYGSGGFAFFNKAGEVHPGTWP